MKKLMCFAVGLVMAMGAFAQSPTLSRIKESGTVKIGVRTNADPFSSIQEGKATGYMVDLCQVVVQDMEKAVGKKLAVQYVPVTPSNRFDMVQSGQVDLECGTTTVNQKRREKVDFTYNTFITSTNFVTLKKNNVQTPHDISEQLTKKGQKMAVMKGTSHEEVVKRLALGNNVNVVYVGSVEEGIQKVQSGEVFGFVQDKVLLEKAVHNLKADKSNLAFSQDSLSLEPYSLMVQKGDTEMLKLVNASLRASYVSGTARKMMQEWLKPSEIQINHLTSDNFRTPSTENAVF